MFQKKTYLSLLFIIILVFGIATTAFADGQISTGEITITPNIDPYEYGTSPDNLYVFLYHGYNPYFAGDFDASECELEHLYVHDQISNEIVEITNQVVIAYTATKDALYYITEDLTVYKTDYTASNHAVLYQCESESVRNFSTYLELLVLIEDDNNVVFVDSNTGDAAVVLTLDGLDWLFMLSESEIMTATMTGEYSIYDLNTSQFTELESEAEMNACVNQAVLSASSHNTATTADVASINAITPKTQENDVSFPLPEYPATIYNKNEVNNFIRRRPLSWFHVNGQEGCSSSNCDSYAGTGECEGFARYAHDAYVHMVDETVTYSAWATARHSNETIIRFDGSVDTCKEFFNSLNPGAYIRYGKDNDPTPENGVHSIVFVNIDNNGIWVYECNQAYDDDPSHGCGVRYQYFFFDLLVSNYQYVKSYVNHSFTEANAYRDSTKHTVGCASCSGYLVESHYLQALDWIQNASTHYANFGCCTGGVSTPHTGTANYTAVSDTRHTLSYSCCSGTVSSLHFVKSGRCTFCGWREGMLIDEAPNLEIME